MAVCVHLAKYVKFQFSKCTFGQTADDVTENDRH